MSDHVDEGVAPEVTAKVWDDYLRRFGPSAYVAARYNHPNDLLLSLIGTAGSGVRPVPLTHDEQPVGADGFLPVRPR